MSSSSGQQVVSISPDDLKCVAELAKLRIPSRAEEGQRVSRVQTLLIAAAQLNRALADYTHHALVHCHGTPGTSDLSEDTRALSEALTLFSIEVRHVTAEYRSVIETSGEPGRGSDPMSTSRYDDVRLN